MKQSCTLCDYPGLPSATIELPDQNWLDCLPLVTAEITIWQSCRWKYTNRLWWFWCSIYLVIISENFRLFTFRNMKASLIMKINFLLALKFRQFGVMMESGMLRNFDPSYSINLCVFFFFHILTYGYRVWVVESWMYRYDATVEAHTPNGYYVSYDSWGNREEVCSKTIWCIFYLQHEGVFEFWHWKLNTVYFSGEDVLIIFLSAKCAWDETIGI